MGCACNVSNRKYIEKERKERVEIVFFFFAILEKNFCNKTEERENEENKE